MGWMAGVAVLPLGCRNLADSRTTIRLANWGGAGDDSEFNRLVQSVYRDFEDRTGIRLRVEGTPGSQDYTVKLLLDYVAGSMPDIVTLDASSAAAFIDNHTLLDLGPFIERDKFDLGAFYGNVVDIARRGQAVYAVPTDFTPMVMYCNKRHFRDAGVDLPTGHWTFAEFLEKAKALTKGTVYGFEFANWMPAWIMFLWNNGGDVLSPDGAKATGFLDSPRSVEAVQFLADLVLKHKASPDLSQAAASGADLFATGQAAMKVVGHWNLIPLKASRDVAMEDIVVVELPTNLPKSVTVMYEAGYAIGAKCKHANEAWEFLKYFSSFEVQRKYNSSGIAVSARKDVEAAKLPETWGVGRNLSPAEQADVLRNQAFQRIVPSARPPWGAQVEGYDRVEVMGQQAMDAILKNNVPVQDALSQAAAEIDQEFARR